MSVNLVVSKRSSSASSWPLATARNSDQSPVIVMFSFIQLPFQLPTFSFPSISLPASIQRRFIAFVLQKSLGHLVKPGQLDGNKINAQLGSGYVEVNDVQLDEHAVNQSLEGLPVKLQEGSLGCVAINLPFQNILTAPLSMTVDRLELSLVLQRPCNSQRRTPTTADELFGDPLTQSVASVAQEFIHEELETSSLRESLILEVNDEGPGYTGVNDDMSTHVPGSLDPFVEDAFPGQATHKAERDVEMLDDVEGVSVLAQVVERLLARLSFKATNITIRIIHGDQSELVLSVGGISYTTEERQESTLGASSVEVPVGEKRTVRIDGIDVFIRDLLQKEGGYMKRSQETVGASPSSETGDASLSTLPQDPPYEDNVDDDEEIDASMTESMVSLPPPASLSRSESDSPTSTIYLSTTSTRAHTPPPHSPDTPPSPPSATFAIEPLPSNPTVATLPPAQHTEENFVGSSAGLSEERTGDKPIQQHELQSMRILSFGKDSVTITLTTPPPRIQPAAIDPRTTANPSAKITDLQALKLSVTVGLITVALRTTQANAILSMVTFARGNHSTKQQPTAEATTRPTKANNTAPMSLLASLYATGTIRGVQLFVFQSNPLHAPSHTTVQELFDHPTSSNVRASHVCFHVEGIEGSYSPTAGLAKGSREIRGGIKELSAFYISTGPQADLWMASPILIADHRLPTQYDPLVSLSAAHYTIPVVNWVDPSQSNASGRPKRALWRTRPPPQSAPKGNTGKTLDEREEVVLEAVSLRVNIPSGGIHVDVAPLHMFTDTAMIGWFLNLIEEIQPAALPEDEGFGGEWEEDIPVAKDEIQAGAHGASNHAANRQRSLTRTPRAQISGLPALVDFDGHEKKRLADMMLPDMDLEKNPLQEEPGIHVRFVMIRCELRHNNSGSQEIPRSGVFVFDLHEPHLLLCDRRMDAPLSKIGSRARFAPEMDSGGTNQDLPLCLVFEWKHALAFYAAPVDSKVTPFLHIGATTNLPQPDIATSAPTEPCRPKIMVRYGDLSAGVAQRASRTTRLVPPLIEPPSSTTSVGITIPSISTRLGKATLDGLQFWADDLTRWAERAFAGKSMPSDSINSSQATSRAPSLLIGSRYFAGRTASSVGDDESTKSAFEIKLNVDDASVQLQVPRKDGLLRPFDVLAADLEAILRIKPEGRDETVIIATVLDLVVQDTTPETVLTLLCLTSPRRLLAPAIPIIAFRLDSISLPDAKAKQSKVQLTVSKFAYTVHPEFSWILDLANFAKAPPGVFEQVIPSERNILSLNVRDGSICILPPHHPGALIINMEDVVLDTELVNGSLNTFVLLSARSTTLLLLDDRETPPPEGLQHKEVNRGLEHWIKLGYAPILHIVGVQLQARRMGGVVPPRLTIDVSDAIVALHLSADTIPTLASFAGDIATMVPSSDIPAQKPTVNTVPVEGRELRRDMSVNLEENAFRKPPALGPEPDMIDDDLPKNADFIDASYGPAAGARPMTEEDLEDFEDEDNYGGRSTPTPRGPDAGVLSSFGGETIRLMTSEGIHIIEGYYDSLPPEANVSSDDGGVEISLRVKRSKLNLHLHSGYDWARTRKTIEEEVKAIRRRLEKIRQLLAQGQTPDASIEKTNALLFNSVYLGLDADDLDEQDLMAAIDANLAEDFETASQESWQSLPIQPTLQRGETKKRRQKTRIRSKRAEVEIEVQGLNLEFDKYGDSAPLSSRILATVEELKILDHMKTSTWDNFLTSMRTDSRGNRRETESDMVRVELKMVRPAATLPQEEARLRAKILPIRLHVDQDALDFLKRFFSFQDANGYTPPTPPAPSPETYFQHVEIFPVDLKLDYKPKRVDYKALKEGKTIELMNFFHFEDAAMTLRRITLTGLTGWARLGDTLNDLWTPDVKANQLADVISGVAPIRSLVNVGTGVADLLLLPIAQYKKDKRLVRGVQKGMAAFMETTAIETIKLGARLATGTQVILEHAEHVLGAGALQDGQGQFGKTITTEAMPSPTMKAMSTFGSEHDGGGGLGLTEVIDDFGETNAAISRYAAQPEDVREGIQTAYKSLSKNLNAAAQTILAVPMEVYEQSGSGGPVRAVVRAVPIAVIRPMIGASEAVRETLLGLRNTIDPGAIQENEDKYKGPA